MSDIKNLHEIIATQKEGIKNFSPEIFEIPKYISENLKYPFFDWQKDAFENLLFYGNPKSKLKNTPTHLMFNMATGTGKTLLMAATILYYYEQGYKHFLFFVNQNNIVDKTENNFIDTTHTKYLFKEKIVIDDKTIAIKKVDNFSDSPQGIEIKFTSIQKLYNDIHLQRENQTTLDDLHSKNIVMLADEAHHFNTDTNKKGTKQQEIIPRELSGSASEAEIEKKGWEHTVIELILHKNGKKENNKNILLEFTATIPATENIAKKYEDKIIYKFGLKEFLGAGYTKEINLISSTLSKKERVLQALLFQWYRHKIALKYGIANFKPVVLFRSKTIDESRQDYDDFLSWIERLQASDFDYLKDIYRTISQSKSLYEQGKSRTEQVLAFIESQNIHFGDIANWIEQNYGERNIIITNSKDKKAKGKKGGEKTTDEQEKLLNSLEDANNHIRAIFTVDRLTEGWDVLNLFDIVRLYQGQNTGGSTKNTPEATTKEKQLIGRGVRYFPFSYGDTIKNKRKFDDDLSHELRVLEELYYYTYDEESRYISHLKDELRKDGYIVDNRIVKTFALKKDFQNTDFYKEVKIWYNKQIDNPKRRKKNLEDIQKDFSISYKIKGLELTEQEIDFETKHDIQKLQIQESGLHTISVKFKDIEKHIVRKAINIKAKQEKSLFQFEQLQKELDIKSIEDLQSKKLSDFDINIVVNKDMQYEDIDNGEKLKIVIKFLDTIFTEFKSKITPKIGSPDFYASSFQELFGEAKTKIIEEKNLDDTISKNNPWYILDGFVGTSEEKGLIEFIKNTIGNLEKKYNTSEIFLLRNEEVYKIFDFDQGRGFQPDFLLFLRDEDIQYQIFIEPKGNNLLENDKWKEDFLLQITEKYGTDKIIKSENTDYRLIGLPFFNQENNRNFQESFGKILTEK